MRRRAFTVVELLIVICIFLIMFGALTPFVRIAKRRVNRIKCAHNLRQISLALHNYAVDNKDAFPLALAALYPDYIADGKVFDCPATSQVGTNQQPNYNYTVGLTEESGPKDILVRDRDGNHKRAGKNILRIDGSVEWITNPRE